MTLAPRVGGNSVRPQAEAKIVRLSESETIPFGPLADYNRLTGDDGLPVFTGGWQATR